MSGRLKFVMNSRILTYPVRLFNVLCYRICLLILFLVLNISFLFNQIMFLRKKIQWNLLKAGFVWKYFFLLALKAVISSLCLRTHSKFCEVCLIGPQRSKNCSSRSSTAIRLYCFAGCYISLKQTIRLPWLPQQLSAACLSAHSTHFAVISDSSFNSHLHLCSVFASTSGHEW